MRLDLGYDGTEFAGWATQPGQRTVQGVLETALALVLRLDPRPRLTVAGRTDAGVHARGQVCHVDVDARWGEARRVRAGSRAAPETWLRERLATALPLDVRVNSVGVAPEGFDARFAAMSRRYAYRICDDPAAVDPLRRREVLVHPRPLDVDAMAASAAMLVGEHDFAAYCRPREGATTIRTLLRLAPHRDGPLVVLDVEADAFCHSMVRALTGALIAVGEGRRGVEWPADVLRAGVRESRVQVAPAHGLTLEEVCYPAASELAARAEQTRRVRGQISPSAEWGSPTGPGGIIAGAAGVNDDVTQERTSGGQG